jgi:hypothetical protein
MKEPRQRQEVLISSSLISPKMIAGEERLEAADVPNSGGALFKPV